MKKKHVSTIFAVATALALISGAAAVAADETVPPPENLPDVRVMEVALVSAETPRAAGGVVRGIVKVLNPSDYPAEAQLEVSVVRLDREASAYVYYAMDFGNEPFSLGSGESADLPFSLQLPAGLSAEGVSVRVQTRLRGSVYRGWGYSEPFDVAGEGGYALARTAFFTLPDGRDVFPLSGPSLYPEAPGDQLPFSVVFEGQGTPLSLTPTVTVANRAAGETSVRTLPPVQVSASGESIAVIPFAHGGQEPGVYEGEISWRDTHGAERAMRIGFRYIVAGQTATVHWVSSSASSVGEGEDFQLMLSVSGTPVDMLSADRGPESYPRGPSRIFVEVVDASENLIASGSLVEVLPLLGEVSLDLTASHAAPSMVAKVTVFDTGNREIFNRTYPLSIGAPEPDPEPSTFDATFLVAAAVAALLLVAALLDWRRFHRRRALVAVLLAAAAWSLACYNLTLAFDRLVWKVIQPSVDGEYCTGPNIYVNAPGNIACGHGFVAEALIQYAVCSNMTNFGSTSIGLGHSGSNVFTGPQSTYAEGTDAGHEVRTFSATYLLPLSGLWFLADGPFGVIVRNQAKISYTGWDCRWTVAGREGFNVTGCDDVARPPTSCVVDKLRTVLGDSVTWTASGCDTQCVWASGVVGPTYSTRSTVPGTLTTTVRSRKQEPVYDAYGGYERDVYGNIIYRNVESSPITCDATIVVEDLCRNLDGVQNPVPTGLSRVDGVCSCSSGTYNETNERCEDDHGNCTSCGGTATCPDGTKYCDGSCIPEDDPCTAIVVGACPIVPPENEYCVEVYNRGGTTSLGFLPEQLELIFGYALPDAARDQIRAIAARTEVSPIFGVVGRVLSDAGSLDARYGSSGCGGTLCAYGSQGCLTTIDPITNNPVANCSPVNDLPGAAGFAPTAVLEVEPSVVGLGGRCAIYWGSHEMSSCTVSGPGLTSTALAGSSRTPELQASATYTLSCLGSDKLTYTDTDTCAVNPAVKEF